ncbi:inositol monophosphatase family protein [Geobacter sp. DSM 9736]|uniref:inositol monophosphatase family protein n=1 Tax=Geobacter sp. DSM 9736 TaxID=1277350 RepID=UPI000B507E1B|nr:inositol monophosphatase family protein [Geobacter sp. DSM 9736]SNB46068.1 myo-inositol-1(or 4)-monophosphatase [Geobacter sp. DSM 9736]
MQQYLEVAIDAAREAGGLQRQRLWLEHDIVFKGATDLVTEVDRMCDSLITERISRSFPDHDILAEESGHQAQQSAYKWIIDPLDGTTNYAHGFPWFCVSIALEIEGTVGMGVIYHPMMDELFTVIQGEGAFLNGSRISVSGRGPIRNTLLATGFPYDRTRENENNFENFVNFHMEARGIRRAGAAALDLAYVAAGRLDGYWECKLKPWDVAAGQLLVKEAGGEVTGYSGETYSIYNHRIVASNSIIHEEMLAVLGRNILPG